MATGGSRRPEVFFLSVTSLAADWLLKQVPDSKPASGFTSTFIRPHTVLTNTPWDSWILSLLHADEDQNNERRIQNFLKSFGSRFKCFSLEAPSPPPDPTSTHRSAAAAQQAASRSGNNISIFDSASAIGSRRRPATGSYSASSQRECR